MYISFYYFWFMFLFLKDNNIVASRKVSKANFTVLNRRMRSTYVSSTSKKFGLLRLISFVTWAQKTKTK